MAGAASPPPPGSAQPSAGGAGTVTSGSGRQAAWESELAHAKSRSQQVAQTALAPPGDCTPAQHAQLQADVDKACKTEKRSCTRNDSPADLDKKIDLNARCITARNRINGACFRGGDQRHKDVLDQEGEVLQNCHDIKAKQQAADGQKQKAKEAAAAAAAAAAAYWIISEGSRLFPPRNLVPVP